MFLRSGCLVVVSFVSCLCELHLLHKTTGSAFKCLTNNKICQNLMTLSSAGFGQTKSKFCRSVRSFLCKWQLSLAKGCKFIQMLFKLMIQRKRLVLPETRSAAYQTSGALTSLNEGLSQVLLHGNIGLSLVANIPSHRTFDLQCQVCCRNQSSTVSMEKEHHKNFKQRSVSMS